MIITEEELKNPSRSIMTKMYKSDVVQVRQEDGTLKTVKRKTPTVNVKDAYKPTTHTKTIKGFVQSMNGHELWVNTTTDEMVKITVNDRDERWKLYCKEVEITIKATEPEE